MAEDTNPGVPNVRFAAGKEASLSPLRRYGVLFVEEAERKSQGLILPVLFVGVKDMSA